MFATKIVDFCRYRGRPWCLEQFLVQTATANPLKVMIALATAAKQSGVRLLEHAEVMDIRRDGHEFVVSARAFHLQSPSSDDAGLARIPGAHVCPVHSESTDVHQIRGDTIVIAAGGLVPFVASLLPGIDADAEPCPIVPVVGQMYATGTAEEHQQSVRRVWHARSSASATLRGARV